MRCVDDYIDAVLSGERIAGHYEKKAVERYLKDLETAEKRGFYFDKAEATEIIELIGRFRHTKGKWQGKPFKLQGWQAFRYWNMYGWKKQSNGMRRFNKSYVKVARKNGKTEDLAAAGNIGLCFDGEKGAEIYWAATKRDQAKIGWTRQKMMMEYLRKDSKSMAKRYSTNTSRIFSTQDDSFAVALGKDSKTEDGSFPHYVFIDEYHAHPDSSLLDVLESGTGARDQPITWIITTAGFNKYSPCKEYEDVCKSILNGTIDNDQTFIQIFDIDVEDDWQNPDVWAKANPSIGVSLNWDFMHSECKKALDEGGDKEISFITKNCNKWADTKTSWIGQHKWRPLEKEFTLEDLRGFKCFAGIDLATIFDIAALCLFFPKQRGLDQNHVLWFYFVPEESAKERQHNDKVPYLKWIKEGHIIATEGSSIDQDYIKDKLLEITNSVQVLSIGIDQWQAAKFMTEVMESGFNDIYPYPQTTKPFNEPIKKITEMIVDRDLVHNGNPVTNWMLGNVHLFKDRSGLCKFDKSGKKAKIDGWVAFGMAKGEFLNKPELMIEQDYKVVW